MGISLPVSCNKKLSKIRYKLSKFPNNVICRKQVEVEGNSLSKIRYKLSKFLNNVICRKQVEVEGNSVMNGKEDNHFLSFDSETHQHSNNGSIPTYVCEIYVEAKPLDISVNIKGCSHFYCIECAVKYIQSKLDDNVSESNVQCWGLVVIHPDEV
ncbi:hypothetical protein J1N35_042664 [Gossypium stocksii]|uniref:Uncharacterized protein n=1 Tax=Gossypium stocksii TaxID=47602 RepID=A0A9D3U5W9_9ROSI|nr:hypothetical protein J1N35_042664 [Gossypium stocksii]